MFTCRIDWNDDDKDDDDDADDYIDGDNGGVHHNERANVEIKYHMPPSPVACVSMTINSLIAVIRAGNVTANRINYCKMMLTATAASFWLLQLKFNPLHKCPHVYVHYTSPSTTKGIQFRTMMPNELLLLLLWADEHDDMDDRPTTIMSWSWMEEDVCHPVSSLSTINQAQAVKRKREKQKNSISNPFIEFSFFSFFAVIHHSTIVFASTGSARLAQHPNDL